MANLIRLDRCFGDILTELGIPLQRVQHDVGLPDGFFHHPVPRLSVERYLAMWQCLVDLTGDPNIGQAVGSTAVHQGFETRRFTHASCDNLAHALERSAQYTALTGHHQMSTPKEPEATTLVFRLRTQGIHPALGTCVLAYYVELGRTATQTDLRPSVVTAPAAHLDTLDPTHWYGAELVAGDDWTVQFDAEAGSRPFVHMPPALMRFMHPRLRFDRPLPEGSHIAQRARHVLLRALPAGRTTLDEVAARLEISGRTLQRRLSHIGSSFQPLLDEVRLELADHYLGTGRTPVEDIAFLVGYANAPSFFRAFQAWTNMTPEAYRDQVEDEAISA